MRRELCEQLPALTRFYGLKPWDIERMTFAELNVYRQWMSDYQQEQSR